MNYKDKRANLIGIILLIVSLIFIMSILGLIKSRDIWYDEVFSAVLSGKSVKELIALTAADVHPPFYYIYLKAFRSFGTSAFPAMEVEPILKCASIIPWLGLAILALTTIRTNYGLLEAGAFLFLTTLMPQVSAFYVEIRMYSLALFLVTAAYVSCMKIIELLNGNRSEFRECIGPYTGLFLFGLCAAYTQYFSCLAVVGIYLILLIALIVYRRNVGRVHIIMTTASVMASVILYLPWLPSLKRQLSGVSSSYWIQPMSVKSLPGIIKYLYLPSSGYGSLNYVAAGAGIIATLVIIVAFLVTKPHKNDILVVCGMLIVPGMIFIVGLLFSVLGHPIFTYRYIVPAVGVIYLSISFMLGKAISKKGIYWAALILPFALIAYLNQGALRFEEDTKNSNMQESEAVLQSIDEGSLVITNFDQTATLMDYYMPYTDVYLYEGEVDSVVQTMFGNGSQYVSEKDTPDLIRDYLDAGKKAYFLGSFNSRDDIVAYLESENVEVGEPVDILIERYWINVYPLKVE